MIRNPPLGDGRKNNGEQDHRRPDRCPDLITRSLSRLAVWLLLLAFVTVSLAVLALAVRFLWWAITND